MYYYVNGTVAEIDAGLAVIDCSGVGYACATTNYTLSQLKKGAPEKLPAGRTSSCPVSRACRRWPRIRPGRRSCARWD